MAERPPLKTGERSFGAVYRFSSRGFFIDSEIRRR